MAVPVDGFDPWMQICRCCGSPWLMLETHSTHTCPGCGAATWIIVRYSEFSSVNSKLQALVWERIQRVYEDAVDSASDKRVRVAVSDLQRDHHAGATARE
jgi:predicted RNA-binding Zn-ribbon protein involved in translation (DUF1610 family)